MQNTTLSAALADIRIPHRHVEAMIRETASSLRDERLDDRLRGEPGFQLKAVDLTQGLVIAMMLAQTLAPEEKFAAMMGPDTFADGDTGLAKLGEAMLQAMVMSPRLGENLVPDETLLERVRIVQRWL